MGAEENRDMEEDLVGLSEDLARWNARRSKEEQYLLLEEESKQLRRTSDSLGDRRAGMKPEEGGTASASEMPEEGMKSGHWNTEELHRYRRAGDKIPEYTAGYVPSEEKFIRYWMSYQKKKIWGMIYLFWLGLGLLAISQYILRNMILLGGVLLSMALIPILLFSLYKKQLHDLYKSANTKHNLPMSLAFYKNYFLMKTERSSLIVYYEEIKNIADVEEVYLIDIGGNALIPVDKDSCSEPCRDFLEAVRKNLLLGR